MKQLVGGSGGDCLATGLGVECRALPLLSRLIIGVRAEAEILFFEKSSGCSSDSSEFGEY